MGPLLGDLLSAKLRFLRKKGPQKDPIEKLRNLLKSFIHGESRRVLEHASVFFHSGDDDNSTFAPGHSRVAQIPLQQNLNPGER